MEIALLIALVLLNGLFAMSEIGLVTARKARLQRLVDEGDTAAAAAMKLGEDPTRFLSTIQIGITSIGILNGIVGEAAFAGPLAAALVSYGVPDQYASGFATGLVVVLITYVSIVLGELVPKRLGQSSPETVARLMARPIAALAVATKPFVRLLSGSTNALLRLLGVNQSSSSNVTEEEIHAVLAEGTSAGVIESHEHAMVRNVFRLDDRQIGSLMVPRAAVVFLDLNRPLEESLARIEESEHASFPVVRGGLNDIVGIVDTRQLLSQMVKKGRVSLDEQLRPALYVPETLTGMELLDNFRSSDEQMAFVIDEYGEVQGLVTLHDLVEAITGEFVPRDPASAWAIQSDNGAWLLDGHIPVPELKDRLELDAVPEEERGRYHTLSGMMMVLTGRMPKAGDIAIWDDWRLEVVDTDGKTIGKVLAARMTGGSDGQNS